MATEKMHKIFVSIVTNMLPWQPKKGFLKTQKVFTSQIFAIYQSNPGREVGDGHRKDPQNLALR